VEFSAIVFALERKTDVLLGKPFLTRYNPKIDYSRNTLTFNTEQGPRVIHASGTNIEEMVGSTELNLITASEADCILADGGELFCVN